MTSKELREIIKEHYASYNLSPKITVVPDGCYIYLGEGSGGHKMFVNIADYMREPMFVLQCLAEVDDRLRRAIDERNQTKPK